MQRGRAAVGRLAFISFLWLPVSSQVELNDFGKHPHLIDWELIWELEPGLSLLSLELWLYQYSQWNLERLNAWKRGSWSNNMVNAVLKQVNHDIYLVDYQSFLKANVFCKYSRQSYVTCYFSNSMWPLGPLAECTWWDMAISIKHFSVIIVYFIIDLFFSLFFPFVFISPILLLNCVIRDYKNRCVHFLNCSFC